MGDDPLQHFVRAQEPVYLNVQAELGAGRKRTHWMWFIFPQIAGLGTSDMAARYALHAQAEAQAYLDHPLLGPRLVECTRLTLRHASRSAALIFGHPDDLKFRSSMTLFAGTESPGVFIEALDVFFSGVPDPRTLALTRR